MYGIPPDLVRYDYDVVSLSAETWHLPRSIFRQVRKISAGRGVKVAVLDTGLAPHPTLKAPVATKSFISGQSVSDGDGHGTHCAGTIASNDEDIGLAPEVDLIIGKVLSNEGLGSSSGIADGVEWAIEQGADVISMSLGGPSAYQPTINAIRKAMNKGVWVCIAAGNSGFNGRTNTIGYPARSGEGICVAALKEGWQPASFSSGGEQMTVAGPGERILSCSNRGSGFVFMSGTSMATPFVAAASALVISTMRSLGNPSLTGVQAIHKFFYQNSTDLLAPGHDPHTGFGMLSVLDVLLKLSKEELVYV